MKILFQVLLITCFLWVGCSKEKQECVFVPDIKEKSTISIEQLQDSLINISSKSALVKLLSRNPEVRDYILRRTEYPDDSVFINEMYQRFNNPHMDTLLQETNRVFGDLSELKSEFEEAFANLKYYYPNYNPPTIKTVISGLDTDLLVTDSLILVSLDFYLGKGAKYRPKMYDYLLRQYEKNNIVPSCMLIYGIGDRFNATDMADKTVLADMIAFGKSYYFAKHMLPCVPDSVFIWYSQDEINGARENQDLIWARFVEDKVIYETNHVIKQKFLGERPKTIEVGEKCPGRIAQWIGWQIINKYAATHSQTTLAQLMQMRNANQLFKESGYKPERR